MHALPPSLYNQHHNTTNTFFNTPLPSPHSRICFFYLIQRIRSQAFKMATFPNLRTHTEYETPKAVFKPRWLVPAGTDSRNHLLHARPQAYVDTPQVKRTEWVTKCGGHMKPLGKLEKNLQVGIIGAGSAGLTTAFHAVMAGANVTLIEARHEVGGRARSVKMGAQNIAEEGCMRFPPSEGDLYKLSEAFGYGYINNFPDPSIVPTLVTYKGKSELWNDHTKTPEGFETVTEGWHDFVDKGCEINGKKFASSVKMAELLQSDDLKTRMDVKKLWQEYIDEFKKDTFRAGLDKIFGPTNKAPPAGKNWTSEDFDRFGKLGIGSGGFGAFFEQCFLTIMRFMPNLWETDQATFVKLVDGKPEPAGISELWQSVLKKAQELGLNTLLNAKATAISKHPRPNSNPIYIVKVETEGRTITFEFDELFINLTTKVANINLNLARTGSDSLFPSATCNAIKTVHMARTTKLFVEVPRFGFFDDPQFPRVLLTDGDLPQAYCLDYDDAKTVVVLLVYAWEEYSKRLEGEKDPSRLFEHLKRLAAKAVANSKYPKWADCLQPVGKIELIHWQDDPTTHGAFTFALPDEDRHCAALFYDFEKKEGPGPYLIGDSASFGGGWLEAGLETAFNCFSAMVSKRGELNCPELAPVNLIKSSTYKY